MKLKALKGIKKLLEDYKESREKYLESVRDDVRYQISNPWTSEQLESFNLTLIMNSAGWLGPHTEKEAKRFVLNENAYLFTKEEYEELKNTIESDTKVLKK